MKVVHSFVAFVLCSCVASLTALEPVGVYLTWLSTPESSIVINWILPEDKEPLLFFEVEKAHIGNLHTCEFPKLPMKIHKVEITGLNPDTVYRFRFSDREQATEYRFRTMPENTKQPIRFAVGGDMMHQKPMMDRTTRLAASKDPHFMIFGGDLAYADGVDAQRWVQWFASLMENGMAPDGRLIPFVVAIGNHEVQGGYGKAPKDALFFYRLFRLPGDKSYYRLDFKDYLSLIVLDTDHTERVDGPQLTWLKHTLSTGPKPPHYFAIYHFPAYGTTKPERDPLSNPLSKKIRSLWLPLFEEAGIQVAFEHDHHTYKRSKTIKAGKVDSEGILFLGDGAWGVNTRIPVDGAWYLSKTLAVRHFILATIEGERRSFEMFDEHGVIIDRYPE